MSDESFERWIAALEARHLAELTFSEVARALRALSSAYVERRGRLTSGSALDGAGKRAAFALYYGPLHYLVVREIVRELPDATSALGPFVDLGCGTGAAGAAWATACPHPPQVLGVDRHPWVLAEAGRTYREFGLSGHTRQGDISAVTLPKPPAAFLAAFALNELSTEARDIVLRRLLDRVAKGGRLLIVEPLARAVTPWWTKWSEAIVAAGGRADEWRFHVELPEIVAKLDRATSLDHRELTARSLWIGGS